MTDQLELLADDFRITPAFRTDGKVESVLQTTTAEDFRTSATDALELTFEGISGDRHSGYTRKSGGREPYYPRGTEMCNERQISILSTEELSLIATRMGLPEMKGEWIGGNIILSGIPNLTMVPPRTRLVFEGGAVIRVDGENRPCRFAGAAIAEANPGGEGLDLLFPQKAKRQRGLVGYVEIPGQVTAGETVTAHVPEQWIYERI
ncbi:molybdenum cofactor sulfurase [Stappia sp. BW2]|uniref:MOSC domain-containing protein n=1 Tax=Stappia sp. BW2 TaxID=2592622 RepID=UPI0011DE9679|nr:molybdenum cofactor sulfurase [Stappia sp. BW2]TYC67213.1 molybdenum cofactor sulfurase [Stappia sp. BW2]